MPRSKSILIDIGGGLSLMTSLTTVTSWNTRNRPKKPKEGVLGYNKQTGSLEYYDGSYWYAAVMEKS